MVPPLHRESSMGIKQFTHFGYSYKHNASLTDSYSVFELTVDATNSPNSAAVPSSCHLDSIEFELSSTDATEKVTMFLARDSAGVVPITTDQLSTAEQVPTIITGSAGGCSFTIGKDFHFDSSVTNATIGSIYVAAKLPSGKSSTAKIRLNWRG
tara:strand:- start:354 stop:815 length:462 start_codon:yes stop_codon:yes gene_type:complete